MTPATKSPAPPSATARSIAPAQGTKTTALVKYDPAFAAAQKGRIPHGALIARGGLNLYKWNEAATRYGGWHVGDRFLNPPWMGTGKATWAKNSSLLRIEMGKGRPIFDTFHQSGAPIGTLQKTSAYPGAERLLLKSHGWEYHPQIQAWMPPGQ